MEKRLLSLALASLMAVSVLSGCGGSGASSTGSSGASSGGAASSAAAADAAHPNSDGNFTKDGKFKVAWISMNDSDAWHYLTHCTAEQVFSKYSDQIEIEFFDKQNDDSRQIDIFEQCIAAGDYGAVVFVCTSDVMDYMDRLHEVGTATFAYNGAMDEYAESGGMTMYRCDDYAGTLAVGEYAVELLPENAKVVELTGTPGSETVALRTKGYMEAIAKRDDVELIASQSADWSKDKAFTIMTDFLAAYDQIDGIFCHNDSAALGAIEAIQAAGLDPKEYVITGVDALYDGAVAISEGLIDASAYQDSEERATAILNDILDIIEGERSYLDYGAYATAPIVKTAENVQPLLDYYVENGLDQ